MTISNSIKARLDIVDVISPYVSLRKTGRTHKGLCPFHNEKTPSFVVSPERQSWHCFGACATGGDLITFVMRSERLQFGEAIKLLAEKAGIALSNRQESGHSEISYRLNNLAADFYQDILRSTEDKMVLDYLDRRGLNKHVRSTFQLGLSPANGDQLKHFFQTHDISLDDAIKAGLLRRTTGGNIRDFFWGRLMFPIHDRKGRVAGFGARALDDSMPKYVNSVSTSIFDKSSTVYGIHLAAENIRHKATAIIVEGYMDTITAHQYGYTNVVASMGTALTEQQVSILKPMATTFVLALDSDAAGDQATLRSLVSSWGVMERQRMVGGKHFVEPLYQRDQLDLKIVSLPKGVDPDELIRSDPKIWERAIDKSVPYMEYMIQILPSRFDLTTLEGKSQAAEAMGPLITSTGDSIKQEHYFHKLGLVLDLKADTLKASFRDHRFAQKRSTRSGKIKERPKSTQTSIPLEDRPDIIEDYVLALLLARPALKTQIGTLNPEQFHSTEDREVFTQWLSCSTIDELRRDLDSSLHDHLNYLLTIELALTDRTSTESALTQCIRRMEQRQLRELQANILASDAVDLPSKEIEDAVIGLNVRLKKLFSQLN